MNIILTLSDPRPTQLSSQTRLAAATVVSRVVPPPLVPPLVLPLLIAQGGQTTTMQKA